MEPRKPKRIGVRPGISWSPVLFLLAFLAVLGVIAYFLLEPMLQMAGQGTPDERRKLAAYAALFVCILLLVLLVGLVISVRMGRALQPENDSPSKPTEYPDAWEEAGRRAKPLEPEEMGGSENEEEDDTDDEPPADDNK
jgi:hypothetical protein